MLLSTGWQMGWVSNWKDFGKMANNPLNLTLRFILELVGLFALGYWGWTQHDGLYRWLLAAGLPLLATVLWGTFRVPNDPGPAPVAVPGWVRLLLEAAYFTSAVLAFYGSQKPAWAMIFGLVVVVHYLISYDRVTLLLRNRTP